MTREEETNERNACDEWFHERGGATIQECWLERARRAKGDVVKILDEVLSRLQDAEEYGAYEVVYKLYRRAKSADYASLHMTPEQAAKEAK